MNDLWGVIIINSYSFFVLFLLDIDIKGNSIYLKVSWQISSRGKIDAIIISQNSELVSIFAFFICLYYKTIS